MILLSISSAFVDYDLDPFLVVESGIGGYTPIKIDSETSESSESILIPTFKRPFPALSHDTKGCRMTMSMITNLEMKVIDKPIPGVRRASRRGS